MDRTTKTHTRSSRIVCFHLFNDYSGSPKVLSEVLDGLLSKDGVDIELISTRGGILDSIESPKLKRRTYSYCFSDNPIVTMLRYLKVQVITFFMALRYVVDRDVTFYINTILPSGPAIAGWLTGKKVVYHYHENAFAKGTFYRSLAWLMQRISHKIICVSDYQASFLKRKSGVKVIPNALTPNFVNSLKPTPELAFERKNVLMLSSLKTYKGTKEFINVATRLPQFNFTLVINDSTEAINTWLQAENIAVPDNATIHPRTSDVASFYNKASMVMNLSNPRLVVETFGLTALEAMSCALPIIVPQVGGIADMVTDGMNGYKIDSQDTHALLSAIERILTDRTLYLKLAENAFKVAQTFSRDAMIQNIYEILVD